MAEQTNDDRDLRNSNLQAEYREVCNNFRTLTDIRFKLLAFLPIGTAAGVGLTVNANHTLSNTLIGLFGLIVTSSVALYNTRNDQLYIELVSRAAELERHLKLKDGAFAHRPRTWRRVLLFPVEHGQIRLIYWASMIAWIFTILHTHLSRVSEWVDLSTPLSKIPGWVDLAKWYLSMNVPSELPEALVATAIVSFMTLVIWWQRERTRNILRAAAKEAVLILIKIPMSNDPRQHNNQDLAFKWKSLLKNISVLSGYSEKKSEKSILFYLNDKSNFYWDRPSDGAYCHGREAAQLIGLVTEMPPRWIFDVASGRR